MRPNWKDKQFELGRGVNVQVSKREPEGIILCICDRQFQEGRKLFGIKPIHEKKGKMSDLKMLQKT